MPLKAATRDAERVVFLGRSDPYTYEAGEFMPPDGRQPIAFPAGTTATIVVGFDDVGYAEVKIKGRDFSKVFPVIEKLGRGVQLDIEYESPRSRGQLPELKSVRLVEQK